MFPSDRGYPRPRWSVAALTAFLKYASKLLQMQYFMRTIEKHKEGKKAFSTELLFSSLGHAMQAARQMVRDSNPAVMLQADACFRNGGT